MDLFEEACREASQRNSPYKLRDILNQHVLVMVCAANPKASKKECIQIGQRLALVQENWIGLLCPLKCVKDGDKDRKYREVVRVVITNFTNKLMEMLVDYKRITYEELENAHIFHSMAATGKHSDEMRKLFLRYLDSLTIIFNCVKENEFRLHAADCIHYADLLGTYLDNTIIK
jgi:hypothetical protein